MVTQGDVISILRDALFTVIMSAAPMLGIAIVIGLTVSIFQATTQINEQTLAFVPKIVAVMLGILLFASFIFGTIHGFVVRLFDKLATILT